MTQWHFGLTHSFAMPRFPALVLLWPLLAFGLYAQESGTEYRVYTEHPRLFLRPRRLQLLKRERQRQSMRWVQFDSLIQGKARMPEPGFALALYYAVSGDAAVGKQAVDWALGSGADLRQLALVYDWCQDLLNPAQNTALAAKIGKVLKSSQNSTGVAAARDRALAAIAIAEQNMDGAESELREIHERWWKADLAKKLNDNSALDTGGEVYALTELLHSLHDNLNLELQPDTPDYFRSLANYLVACNYPAPYPAPENAYWIPIFNGTGNPDLNRAALARAAGLALVAYDGNALPNQFLQGWLMQDRFQLNSAFGAPYEFLWANPYQPGLAYSHLPLVFHDTRSGALFLRSSWDEDATWFAIYSGQAQLFRDGRITVLARSGSTGQATIKVGNAAVLTAKDGMHFEGDSQSIFLIGLKPKTTYRVEVDDEEMSEFQSDALGTLELQFSGGGSPGVRIEEALLNAAK